MPGAAPCGTAPGSHAQYPRLQLAIFSGFSADEYSVRRSLPDGLVSFLDSEGPADLRADLRAIRDSASRLGWAAAVEGALSSLEATGGVDAATLELSAAVSASGRGRVEYDEPVDLAGYDRAFELLEGGASDAEAV